MKEIKDNRTWILYTVNILEILNNNGIDVHNLLLNYGHKKNFCIKDIEQPRIDINKIIKDNNLNPFYKIVARTKLLLEVLYNKENITLSSELKDRIETLNIAPLDTKSSTLDYVLIEEKITVLEILNREGVDLSNIQCTIQSEDNSTRRWTTIEEINQPGIDIKRIIKEYNLNPKAKVGQYISHLRYESSGISDTRLDEVQKSRIKNLHIGESKLQSGRQGLMTIKKNIRILKILYENGVDLNAIPDYINLGGKHIRSSLLGKIEQPGIDIEQIINENHLNPDIKIGSIKKSIIREYNRKNNNLLTEEDKKDIESIGIVPSRLHLKEQEQQDLQQKLKEANKLKEEVQKLKNNEQQQ